MPSVGFTGSQMEGEFGIPAHLLMDAEAEGCFNSPGPKITLSGTLTLGAVGGEVHLLSNPKANPNGQHKTDRKDVTVSVVLKSESLEDIVVPKPPPDPKDLAEGGGVGGNPWIFIRFKDDEGVPYHNKPIPYHNKPIPLGRCVQGLDSAELLFALAAYAAADITTSQCHNSPGPYVRLEGYVGLGGIQADLILSNTRKLDSNGAHTNDENTVTVEVVIKPVGDNLTFYKQPSNGGAGGNPYILFNFTDADGEPYSDPVSLGRCVEMSN
jgi:hypothetical protein